MPRLCLPFFRNAVATFVFRLQVTVCTRLDALAIALDQAHQGGSKRWYASTLDLQLASLELCVARRAVSMLHVHIKGDAPRSLWYPSTLTANPTPNKSKYPKPRQIPLVEAVSITCSVRSVLLDKVQVKSWMVRVEELKFCDKFNQPIAGIVWPPSLQQFFGCDFNQPISGVLWPASLQHLLF